MERAIDRAAAVLAAQHGVAHLAQLRRLGVTDEQVRARLASGSWAETAPYVVAVNGTPATGRQRVWRAYVATRTRADGGARPVAVGGPAAAALLGVLPDVPEEVEVVAGHDLWVPRVPGVRVRKVLDWPERRFVRVEGLLVTALADTLVDLAPHAADGAYLALLQEQCYAHPRLLAAVLARCHRGSKGSARARRVGTALAAGADSVLHARALAALRGAGLAPSTCDTEAVPGAGRSDCLYVVAGRPVLALEFDGDVHRLSRRAFLHDRAKDLALREAGCGTLRFTVEQVDRPAVLVRAVRRALTELEMSPRGTGAA